jgi:ABC-2 type transport system ATP-binding protein
MRESSDFILETRGLIKSFDDVQAVRGVDLQIRQGICFGLLGPNGAGKTTTIELMEGIQAPTGGEILYHGAQVTSEIREKIGIQFQSTSLPDFLTVREVLRLFQSFYKKSASVESLVERCALAEFLPSSRAVRGSACSSPWA